MKNFLIIFIAFFCSLSSFAQNNTKKTRAQIYFTKTLHTFDTIPLGKGDTCIFQYKTRDLHRLLSLKSKPHVDALHLFGAVNHYCPDDGET